jgi:glucokinase
MTALAQCAIGVDLGGTKCAAAAVLFPEGRIIAQVSTPTLPHRGSAAVLADVILNIRALRAEAEAIGEPPAACGLAIAELVSPTGELVSHATFHWQGEPLARRIALETGLTCRIDADVRAAAHAEAQLGAGRGAGSFLYITIGTGISASLVVAGQPYRGARGLTGTFASSPVTFATDDEELRTSAILEQFAAGPTIARRYTALVPSFSGDARDVLQLADGGEQRAQWIIESAGAALGSAIGGLVNMLDPELVILGGGLGAAAGRYRDAVDAAMRSAIYADAHRNLPLVSAALGADSGVIGAASIALHSSLQS